MKLRQLLPALLCLSLAASAPAESPGIHTDRTSPKVLPLPKGDDVFHFLVFGDRTGGPAEGIQVLAQAVADANLLDPDLVMTVGDLVNGYNQTGPWLKQMEEFQATMGKLKMPWFPVAGNHDIYWRRDAKAPEAKPPREHEDNYEKHFGPLWYWFEHKQCGFLVLFSDEGHPDGRVRDFSAPEQQQISRRQLDWMASALAEMKRLKHVFVFLHHPFWWNERYPASNWDEVHRLLVRNGNVRAVLAGHIHQMRYDGVRDGIGYYALATTGGTLTPGMQYQHFGLLHHFNVVTVRDTGFQMASVPVGTVFDPKQFTPARLAEVEAARYLLHEFTSPPLAVRTNGGVSAVCRVAVTNPCTLPLDITLLAKGDPTWVVAPDHRHTKLPPEEGRVFEFACVRDDSGTLEGFEPPEFELRFDVLTPDARLAMPPRSLRARATLLEPAGGWPAAPTNACAVFNGKDACLEIEQEYLAAPEGPFTVEAWVKPADDKDGGIVANLKIGGFSLEVAGAPRFSVQTDGPLVNERSGRKLKPAISAKAESGLRAGRWSHLAGVYDGAQIVLYVNGRKAASTPATAARLTSDKSLYIGARPNPAWNVHNVSTPTAFWNGTVDDVRLSRGARYTGEFKPETRLTPDAVTVVGLDNDRHLGPFVPLSAAPGFQALRQGGVQWVTETR